MIKWIIIFVIGLIVLGYLGFDIRKAVESPVAQTNLEYAKEAVSYVWTKYLAKPVKYVFNEIFIKYIWKPAIENLNNAVKNKDDEKVRI